MFSTHQPPTKSGINQKHPAAKQSRVTRARPAKPDAVLTLLDQMERRGRPKRDTETEPLSDGAEPAAAAANGKPLLLTVPEAAWELRLQRRFLDRAIEEDLVRVVHFGRAKRIHRDEI